MTLLQTLAGIKTALTDIVALTGQVQTALAGLVTFLAATL